MKATTARVYPRVSTDGTGVVSHAGSALLRELADRVGLRTEFAAAVDGIRCRAVPLMMTDDGATEAMARAALELVGR